MANIRNKDEFERWLENKPSSWAQILACRAALRVLPLAMRNAQFKLQIFRAVGISFAARNIPAKDMNAAARAAAAAAARPAAAYAAARAAYAAAASAYAVNATPVGYAAAAARAAAAAAAARAARAADPAAAAAAAVIWSSLEADASWLEAADSPGNAAEAMTALPLWYSKRPDWFDQAWQAAKRDLVGDGDVPDPWIGWFDRRIAGHDAAFALPRAADEAIQIRIAAQDDAFWKLGSAAVNADIQAWIDAAALFDDTVPPDVPPQRPNELITTVRDGHIALVHRPPLPTTPDQDQRRRDAWQAIRDALDDYLADGPSDNHPRLNRMIDRLARALGAEFDALNPVGLGVQAQYLQQYAARAGEFLIADRAADLVGLNAVVGSLLPQFAEWRAYGDDSGARTDVSAETLNAATAIVASIAEQDVAEPEVNAVLTEMAADANDEAAIADLSEVAVADPGEAAAADPKLQTYRQRLIGGLGNTLATMAKIALDDVKWLTRNGWKLAKSTAGYVIKAGDPGLQEAIKAGTKYTALFVIFSAMDSLLALAGLQPGLAWLGPLLVFLKANVLKD